MKIANLECIDISNEIIINDLWPLPACSDGFEMYNKTNISKTTQKKKRKIQLIQSELFKK